MAQSFNRKTSDSNLFSINFDSIEEILADVNSDLIIKAEKLLNKSNNFLEITKTEEAEDLKDYLKELRSIIIETSQARLSDGRPFVNATKVVKNWFGKTENKLKRMDKELSKILNLYISDVIIKNSEIKSNNPRDNNEIKEAPDNAITTKMPNLQLEWEVIDFDKELLDLEILREYLSDYSIMIALKNHLKANGPNQIKGAIYAQVIPNKL
ncbi:hypothetical protein OAI04_03400 [Hyphomicrobiales bacterium]|jgi:hypothetical protein|nr:hypothetical protein [Hyphomicrobiales bacterium]